MFRGKCGKVFFFLLPLAALFLGTCGLEDYPSINPIPQARISQQLNNRAEVRVPSSNDGTALADFHFEIFYRIYVSDTRIEATTISDSLEYQRINLVLNSDYNTVSRYIDSETLVNVNMNSMFSGMGYKNLYLQNGSIESVLSSSVLGSTLIFYFPPDPSINNPPTMTIGSSVYTLWRSNDNGRYTPRPDRYFINNDDLWNSEYITSNINADVVNKSGITASDPHFTYVAMFITAVGVDAASYSYVYSTPSMIHVFLLPDP